MSNKPISLFLDGEQHVYYFLHVECVLDFVDILEGSKIKTMLSESDLNVKYILTDEKILPTGLFSYLLKREAKNTIQTIGSVQSVLPLKHA